MSALPSQRASTERVGLLVSSAGGHLSELFKLHRWIDGVDRFVWACPETAQSRSLLAGLDVHHIEAVRPRDAVAAARLVPVAQRLLNELQPSVVVSTGAAPAVPFLTVAAARGIPAHYIESFARLDGPSMTGRMLRYVPGVQRHVQGMGMQWKGWHPTSSVLDSYRVERVDLAPIRQAVVTVGTEKYCFRRMLQRLVAILPPDVQVLWQTGASDTDGLDIEARPFVPARELRSAISEADVVIGHAGCGTALDSLDRGKLPVLAARSRSHGEHVDDHQHQIARRLDALGLAVAVDASTVTLADLQLAASHRVTARDERDMVSLS